MLLAIGTEEAQLGTKKWLLFEIQLEKCGEEQRLPPDIGLMSWEFVHGTGNRFINQRIIQGVELRFVYIGSQLTNHRSLFLIDKDAEIKGVRFLGICSIYPLASIFCHLDSICLAVSTVNYIIIFDDKILCQTQRVTVVTECCRNIRLGSCMDATDSGAKHSSGDLPWIPRHCLDDCFARFLAVAKCRPLGSRYRGCGGLCGYAKLQTRCESIVVLSLCSEWCCRPLM